MGKQLIMVPSVTYAMKSKKILVNHNISSDIERTPKHKSGKSCGYSLYVPFKTEEAVKILEDNGIKVLGVIEKGEQNDIFR